MTKLGDWLSLDFTTKHPTTGQASVADSTPVVKVYEDSTTTDMGLSVTVLTRTGLTGAYFFVINCSTGNGFEVGKMYNVYVTAIVGGVTQNKCIATFGVSDVALTDLPTLAEIEASTVLAKDATVAKEATLGTPRDTDIATDIENISTSFSSDVNIVQIGGNPINDYSAILRLGQLDIQSTSGPAMRLVGSGADPGLQVQGGDTGHGVEIVGGATSGAGVVIQTTAGDGISIAATGRGIEVIAAGADEGVYIQAGNTGIGLRVVGGATSGQGVRISTTDGHGVHITAAGSGKVDVVASKDLAISAITYNPDNTYNTITLADGRVITFTYAAGQLTGVTYS